MSSRSIANPSTPTRIGATTSATQKLRVYARRNTVKYAPSMYSEPWAKFTTVMSPKIRESPIASRTKIIPSTRPVKTCGRMAERSMITYPLGSPSAAPRQATPLGSPSAAPRQATPLGSPSAAPRQDTAARRSCKTLFGAGAVVLLVGRHASHDVGEAPLPLGLAGTAPLHDPHVLEGLVVTRPPPLLALEVVVGGALPQGV